LFSVKELPVKCSVNFWAWQCKLNVNYYSNRRISIRFVFINVMQISNVCENSILIHLKWSAGGGSSGSWIMEIL
jgi:hypothetical protein